mmetsp:Transcript_139383/g.197322  ORF Transcript_139383/g.197322 Transcript_139383/m.197322 type:complete len:192 (+) Transcript_139383:187-762(+)
MYSLGSNKTTTNSLLPKASNTGNSNTAPSTTSSMSGNSNNNNTNTNIGALLLGSRNGQDLLKKNTHASIDQNALENEITGTGGPQKKVKGETELNQPNLGDAQTTAAPTSNNARDLFSNPLLNNLLKGGNNNNNAPTAPQTASSMIGEAAANTTATTVTAPQPQIQPQQLMFPIMNNATTAMPTAQNMVFA